MPAIFREILKRRTLGITKTNNSTVRSKTHELSTKKTDLCPKLLQKKDVKNTRILLKEILQF